MTAESVIVNSLHDRLSKVDVNKTIWIAFSGGLDSTVLLHAVHSVVASTNHSLCAIHINHQLHADSADWSQHCSNVCNQLSINFNSLSVDTQPWVHLGVEGAAREARYKAFADTLKAKDILLTAHHADDQIETVLLQLFRGAGAHGLAACAATRALGDAVLMRPLLDVSRDEIKAYAQQHKLRWLDDPSNDSLQFDRNYLRHSVTPLLHARWAGLHETINRTAQWQSEHMELLNDLAQIDLSSAKGRIDRQLACDKLIRLSNTRLRNALRWWIRQNGFPAPSAQVMQHILANVVNAGEDREPVVSWQGCEVRKYRNTLYIQAVLLPHDATLRYQWDLSKSLELPSVGITLTCEGLNVLGIELNDIKQLQVGFRVGGEVMRPRGRGCQKELKTLFQEAGVVPWIRNRIPLLFDEDQLICVWGYWVAEGY